MAPKLSSSMNDPRLKSDYGTPVVPQSPTGAASLPPSGLLKANGALQPSANTTTLAGNWPTVGNR